MSISLTPEQSNALKASSEHRLPVVDPATNRRYVIVDAEALAKLETIEAIRSGLAQMAQGDGQPLPEAMNDIRAQLKQRA